MAKKYIKSRPGLFGYTNYYDERGRCVGKSRPGALGSTGYFDEKGRIVGKSRKGFLAKEVYHDVDHTRQIATYDSIVGEIHCENGVPIGHTRPGFFVAAYTTLEAEDEHYDEEYFDEDDLTEDLECDGMEDMDYTPERSQYTVVRNLQQLALCLVICMVIAAIYAIVKFN